MIVTMISTYKLLYDVCIVSPHIKLSFYSAMAASLPMRNSSNCSPCLPALGHLICFSLAMLSLGGHSFPWDTPHEMKGDC